MNQREASSVYCYYSQRKEKYQCDLGKTSVSTLVTWIHNKFSIQADHHFDITIREASLKIQITLQADKTLLDVGISASDTLDLVNVRPGGD